MPFEEGGEYPSVLSKGLVILGKEPLVVLLESLPRR
jgi:hypothetical protein